MEKVILADKYPVFKTKIDKSTASLKSIDEILKFLKSKIDSSEVATFIAIFDHYNHTNSLTNKEIAKDILDAKNIIFCYGIKLPNPEILSLRPRSIGVCETKTDFVISFLEAPMEFANTQMREWIKEIERV